MDLKSTLKRFGLTGQEATMYLTLSKHGPLTGYEAANRANISRSNAYAALSGLCSKGGAMKSGEGSKQFVPTPKSEFLHQLEDRMARDLEFLDRELPEYQAEEPPYLTISGDEAVLAHIRRMLAESQSHVYVAAHPDEIELFADALEDCTRRGVKTVVMSDTPPNCPGVIHHATPKEKGHVNIIADTACVLTGVMASGSGAQCLFTRNGHLVRLMRSAFSNELQCLATTGKET